MTTLVAIEWLIPKVQREKIKAFEAPPPNNQIQKTGA
jgi:hypothetical protein